MTFYEELETAMSNLEDETARHKIKIVIEDTVIKVKPF